MHNVSNILSPFLKSENPKKNHPCVMWHRDFSVKKQERRLAELPEAAPLVFTNFLQKY
jgi:hypothetical protein